MVTVMKGFTKIEEEEQVVIRDFNTSNHVLHDTKYA